MGRALKVLGLVVAASALALQLRQPDRTNPPVEPALVIGRHLTVPDDVAAILDRACRDCHSNETRWPAYAYVAPISWEVAEHVANGRQELNLSEWGTYDRDTAQDLLTVMCRQARSRDMPLPSYTRLHRRARLTDDEIARLCAWTAAERRKLRDAE
jgi:hypothetical protein